MCSPGEFAVQEGILDAFATRLEVRGLEIRACGKGANQGFLSLHFLFLRGGKITSHYRNETATLMPGSCFGANLQTSLDRTFLPSLCNTSPYLNVYPDRGDGANPRRRSARVPNVEAENRVCLIVIETLGFKVL